MSIQKLFVHERFIVELQNFVEDQQYARSYQLEPKGQLSLPVLTTPLFPVRAQQSDNNMDLMSLTVDQFSRSFSEDHIQRPGHTRAMSDGVVRSSDMIKDVPAPFPVQKPNKITRSSGSASFGRKKDVAVSTGLHETITEGKHDHESDSSWSREEVNAAMGSGGSVGRIRGSLVQSKLRRQSQGAADMMAHSIAFEAKLEWADFFSNAFVMKESVLDQKIKCSIVSKKSTKSEWTSMWFRLFPTALVGYQKKALSHKSGDASPTPDVVYKFHSKFMVDAATDYKKRSHVFRIRPSSHELILLQAHSESDVYDWIAMIQKS